jgi:hypothetical protein
MNIFKKIISVNFLLILVLSVIPSEILAQSLTQRANIIIGNVNLNKEIYNSGETINGSFELINTSNVNASNIQYTVSLVGDFDENGIATTLYDKQKSNENFFIAGNNKISTNFNYPIPETISGENLSIEIQAWDGAGVPHGWGNKNIDVQGQGGFISVSDAYIFYDDIEYTLQHGVTLSKDAVLTVDFEDLGIETVIFPNLKIYNRSIVSGDLISDQKLSDLEIISGQQNTLTYNINPNQDSGVYEGLIEFINSNGQKISNDIAFRYIIPGQASTIQSVHSDKQSLKKGDSFNVKVQIIGAPYSMNFETEGFRDGSDNPDESLLNSVDFSARLEVKIKNSIGQIIAEGSQIVKYNENPLVSFDFISNLDSNNFIAEVNLINENDDVLNSDTFILATGEDSDGFNNNYLISIFIILLILIIIISVLIIKNKKQNIGPATMIILGTLLLGIGALGIYTHNEKNISQVNAQNQIRAPYWETTNFSSNEENGLLNRLKQIYRPDWEAQYHYNELKGHDLRPGIYGVHLQDIQTGQTITGALKPGQEFRVRYSGQIQMCLNVIGEIWRNVRNNPQGLSLSEISSINSVKQPGTGFKVLPYSYSAGQTSGNNIFRAPTEPGNYTVSVRVENYPRGQNNHVLWQLGRTKFIAGEAYLRGWEEGLIHYVVEPDSVNCSASPETVYVGQEVTWTVNTTAQNYSWIGTEELSGNTQTIKKIYNERGQKNARVTLNPGQANERSVECTTNILPMKASCDISPNPATDGQNVTWTAEVTGGSGPYTYNWSGNALTESGQIHTKSYDTGLYSTTLTITDSLGKTATQMCNLRVNCSPGDSGCTNPSSGTPGTSGTGGDGSTGPGLNQNSLDRGVTAFPALVNKGSACTIVVNVKGAQSCTITGEGLDEVVMSNSDNNISYTINALQQTTVYKIKCLGTDSDAGPVETTTTCQLNPNPAQF